MKFIKKIAETYIQIYSAVVIILFVWSGAAGLFALVNGNVLMAFALWIISSLVIILVFGMSAIFILIYKNLQSINNKM
jgi:hypothetical protein|tara:strand:+ start:216 stop:449 length:234 start_codon:yes stop_codon:yes gene_type:complete